MPAGRLAVAYDVATMYTVMDPALAQSHKTKVGPLFRAGKKRGPERCQRKRGLIQQPG